MSDPFRSILVEVLDLLATGPRFKPQQRQYLSLTLQYNLVYLITSASAYFGSCLSMKHARISSQWKEPLCVPIFMLSISLGFLFGDWSSLMNAWAVFTVSNKGCQYIIVSLCDQSNKRCSYSYNIPNLSWQLPMYKRMTLYSLPLSTSDGSLLTL